MYAVNDVKGIVQDLQEVKYVVLRLGGTSKSLNTWYHTTSAMHRPTLEVRTWYLGPQVIPSYDYEHTIDNKLIRKLNNNKNKKMGNTHIL